MNCSYKSVCLDVNTWLKLINQEKENIYVCKTYHKGPMSLSCEIQTYMRKINKIVNALITAILCWTKCIWETDKNSVFSLVIIHLFWEIDAFLKSLYGQLCHSRLAIVFSFNLMYHMFKSVEEIMFNWQEIARTLKHFIRNFKNRWFLIYLHHHQRT